MKDISGNEIGAGDKFMYQVGEPHECTGEVFNCGGVDVIKWDDGADIMAVHDFYYQPTDQKILKKL
jgi:hypothetical protein